MQQIFDHIDRIKEKPHHIRRQIAFAVAFGVAALIGFVWLVGSLAMGTFALGDSNFAQATGAEAPSSSGPGAPDNSQLAGAAAAAPNTGAGQPAHIEIIDASTTTAPQPEQTVIPF